MDKPASVIFYSRMNAIPPFRLTALDNFMHIPLKGTAKMERVMSNLDGKVECTYCMAGHTNLSPMAKVTPRNAQNGALVA
jgi:hypothetical protein